MTLYDIKPKFQSMLHPLVKRMANLGITANWITLSAAFGSIIISYLLSINAEIHSLFLIIPVWMFIRMALNAIDGMLAREFGQQSKLGALLNEICDVVSDAALYIPFAFIAPFSVLSVSAVIFLATVSEFMGALGLTIGASRRYDGPMGKSDRAFIFGALGLWVGITNSLPIEVFALMPILAILLIMTIFNRGKCALTETY